MEYQVSARKHRPMIFEDVSGQPHVVRTLTNALTTGRTAHAYLFSGMRGVGKTTMARILAKALNCVQGPTAKLCLTCPSCVEIGRGSALDVMEIDGASSNSVDDVREMRETIKTAPARDRYRVYIIDEVHMLSTAAFNALLKTLEEPPAHVVFIFATTECHKIPQTILSRCQHFTFRRISRREIVDQLRRVAQGEGIAVDDKSLGMLARAADGSMRDALSLLDQAVAFGGKEVRSDDLMALLGSVSHQSLRELVTAIVEQDPARALRAVAAVQDRGSDLRQFCSELMEHIRNVLVAKMVPGADDLIELAPEELAETKADAARLSVENVQEIFRIFHQTEEGLRSSQHPWFLLEMAVVRACRLMIESGGGGPGKTGAGPATPEMAGSQPKRPASINRNAAIASARPASAISPARPEPAETGSFSLRTAAFPVAPADSTPQPAQIAGSAPKQPAVEQMVAAKSGPADYTHAPQAPQDAPLPGVNGGLELSWEAVVERVHSEKPNLGAFLEETALVRIENDIVTIGYRASGGASMKMILKEDYQRLILEACQAIAGRSVRLRVVTLDAGASMPTVAQLRREREAVTEEQLRQETLANPVVQEVLSVFSGEVKEVRRKPVETVQESGLEQQ
ncbi:MAG: DNA polymerase III subunit gamma/tau [Nitrospirota bacterium]